MEGTYNIRFVDVNDYLPKDKNMLFIRTNNFISTGYYDLESNIFHDYNSETTPDVTHWAKVPKELRNDSNTTSTIKK